MYFPGGTFSEILYIKSAKKSYILNNNDDFDLVNGILFNK